MLAVRASRTGAIDYSTTTRDDIFSIMRESLVLRDIKREMLADAFSKFDAAYSVPQNRVFQHEFVKNAIPWAANPASKEEREQALIDDLVSAWYQFEEEEKLREANNDATEQTGLSE